jgi:periplasmic protein TonB
MKRKLFSSMLLLISFIFLKAQNENKVFEKIEVDAHTNQKAWAEHISKKTQLPDSVLKDIPAGTYKVNVQFIVDVHGNMGQIKALNDPGYGLGERAINAVSSYKGEWKSANQCGRNVKAYKKEVIVFIVPSR